MIILRLVRGAGSELGHPWAWQPDTGHPGAEVDDQGGLVLEGHDRAAAVPVVGHLVLKGVFLGRRLVYGRLVERASSDEAPGAGAVSHGASPAPAAENGGQRWGAATGGLDGYGGGRLDGACWPLHRRNGVTGDRPQQG